MRYTTIQVTAPVDVVWNSTIRLLQVRFNTTRNVSCNLDMLGTTDFKILSLSSVDFSLSYQAYSDVEIWKQATAFRPRELSPHQI